ncbi:MAG: hypothetical protein WBG08_05775 [Litorimonas sp.]
MSVQREKFATQMESGKLSALRDIAKTEGRQFQVVLEEAVEMYLKERSTYKMRPEVREAYESFVAQFPKTLEMLSK